MREQGVFSHDILLSNGQEIGLVFDDVRFDSFELHPLGTGQKLEMTDRILQEGQELAKTILTPGGRKRSPGLVAKAKELRITIRDLKKQRTPGMPDLPTAVTKTGKARKVAVCRVLRSYHGKPPSSPARGLLKSGPNARGDE